MKTVLGVIGIIVLGVVLFVALCACKASSEASKWEEFDGR